MWCNLTPHLLLGAPMLRSGLNLAGLSFVLTACVGTDGGTVTGEPWTLGSPSGDLTHGISVLVLHDMEASIGSRRYHGYR